MRRIGHRAPTIGFCRLSSSDGASGMTRVPTGGARDADLAFIRERRVAHLATADKAGRPSVVPVCYAVIDDGGEPVIAMAIDEKPKGNPRQLRRVRNILARPKSRSWSMTTMRTGGGWPGCLCADPRTSGAGRARSRQRRFGIALEIPAVREHGARYAARDPHSRSNHSILARKQRSQ